MKNVLRFAMVLVALGGMVSAQQAPKAPAKAANSKSTKRVAPAAVTADDMKQLKDSLATLQQQMEQLRQENASLAERLKQSQTKSDAAQAAALEAQQRVAALEEQKPTVAQTQADAAATKKALESTTVELQKTAKRVDEMEEPVAIRYKGVKLTPGGYLQAATVYRTHNANSDTSDSYGSFPLSGSTNSKLSEFRLSGRASRLSLKAEGASKTMKFMGYMELDFLGASPTSNESQTNSFNPRLRLAFGEAKFAHGWTIAAGQNWSMIQTTKKGIDSLSEWLPSLIDNSYTPGFSYAREGSIRVTKELVEKKAWLGFSIENPETVANVGCVVIASGSTATAACPSATPILNGAIQGTQNTTVTGSPSNGFSTAASTSGALLSSPSNDAAPDLVAKFAVEPGWGHYEVKAIGRFFKDRVNPQFFNASSLTGANNHVTEGFGVGIGAIMPVVPKKVDIEVHALGGKGIGRFGVTGGPDVTVNTNGDLVPVKSFQAIVGIETHPTPKLDLNIYGGDEYFGRTTYSTTGLFGGTATSTYIIGYGASRFIDSGCPTETASGSTCMSSSQNRNVWAVQPVMWYRVYKGKQGTLQLGASYAYVYRRTWDGTNAAGTLSFRPLAIQNIVMTSIRYYLP